MPGNPKESKTHSKSNAADQWQTIKLDTDGQGENKLLGLADKDDSVDSSRLLVRKNRFCSSFMMATNGGATFEDLLRPHASAASPLPGDDSPRAHDQTHGLQNVLGASDERRLIADTSYIPARSVGLVKILPKNGTIRYGTAWLIGPRTLATAAHNLLHPQAGPARRLDVGMAHDGNQPRGGWHRVVDNKFSKGWEKELTEGSPYDFAVIKIENPDVGNKLGWFGFSDYEDEKFGSMVVNIFGYPLDRKQFHMYGVAGRVVDFDQARIYYDCDTGGGMSGGPVIARFGEQRIAVGIHVAGGVSSNVGTRINDVAFELFKKYRDW